ncbi:MAG: hypothetical protein Q9227_006747 [Pyrenula ochraceoflavens]
MGDEVLISSTSCGTLYAGNPNVSTNMIERVMKPYLARTFTSHANYVQTCYTNTSETNGCGSFVRRQLPSKVNRNAPCPFRNGTCRNPTGNLKLDTGYLYIDSDLGFNVPAHRRYRFRITTDCAPLATENFKRRYNYSSDISYMRYFYGPILYGPDAGNDSHYTYEAQIPSASKIVAEDMNAGWGDYKLNLQSAYTYNGSWSLNSSTFSPKDELLQENSDLHLAALSAGDVIFSAEVQDAWYAAHQPLPTYTNGNGGSENVGRGDAYMSDEPGSPLACKMHYEGCNPESSPQKGCPISGGLFDFVYPTLPPETEASSVFQWILSNQGDIATTVQTLTTGSLTSKFSLMSGLQGPLPDDQWQSDVEFWFNILLTSLQSVVYSALGPSDPAILQDFWLAPNDYQGKHLCNNQKIRSSAYSNFSVLGLSIVLIIGGLIIIIGYTLESYIDVVEDRFYKTHKYSRLEWAVNDILQTQRLAHEELGIGDWKGCAGVGAIPVTEKGQHLAVLDVQDPKHPRLKAPLGEDEKGDAMTELTSTQANSPEDSQAGTAALDDVESLPREKCRPESITSNVAVNTSPTRAGVAVQALANSGSSTPEQTPSASSLA